MIRSRRNADHQVVRSDNRIMTTRSAFAKSVHARTRSIKKDMTETTNLSKVSYVFCANVDRCARAELPYMTEMTDIGGTAKPEKGRSRWKDRISEVPIMLPVDVAAGGRLEIQQIERSVSLAPLEPYVYLRKGAYVRRSIARPLDHLQFVQQAKTTSCRGSSSCVGMLRM